MRMTRKQTKRKVQTQLSMKKCPTLSELSIPFSSDFVQKQTLCDIVQWNGDIDATKTMSAMMMNSVEISSVQMAKSGGASRAKRNECELAWLHQSLSRPSQEWHHLFSLLVAWCHCNAMFGSKCHTMPIWSSKQDIGRSPTLDPSWLTQLAQLIQLINWAAGAGRAAPSASATHLAPDGIIPTKAHNFTHNAFNTGQAHWVHAKLALLAAVLGPAGAHATRFWALALHSFSDMRPCTALLGWMNQLCKIVCSSLAVLAAALAPPRWSLVASDKAQLPRVYCHCHWCCLTAL